MDNNFNSKRLEAFKCFSNSQSAVITGSINSGKSTLLSNFLEGRKYKAIRSYKSESPDGVLNIYTYIEEISQEYLIARISKSERIVFTDIFSGPVLKYLNSLQLDNDELFVVDEIGFIESKCDLYLKKLIEIFKNHPSVFVARKNNGALWQYIPFDDFCVFDLDNFPK